MRPTGSRVVFIRPLVTQGPRGVRWPGLPSWRGTDAPRTFARPVRPWGRERMAGRGASELPTQRAPERFRSVDPLWLTRWLVLLVLLLDSLRYGVLRGAAPPQVLVGLGVLGVAVLLNVALRVGEQRVATPQGARRVALTALLLDAGLVTAFVTLYAFEPASGHHLLLFLLVVAAATLFRLAGAAVVWAYGAALWSATWWYADTVLGLPKGPPGLFYPLIGTAIVALATGLLAERVQRQQQLLAAALEARERELAWRRSLIDMLAHDLRAPLATASSSAELLVSRSAELPRAQIGALSDAARRQIRRALRLLDDLLDLGRASAGALTVVHEAVTLDAFVTEVLEELPSRFAQDVDLELDAHGAAVAAADQARLSQVLWNLLTNAQKHGAPPVVVQLRDVGDGTVELEVRDRGPGVDPTVLETMYEAFSTTGNNGSTGLGLWISHLLVQAMDGELRHERDDGWTRFTVRLPAAEPPPSVTEQPLAHRPHAEPG